MEKKIYCKREKFKLEASESQVMAVVVVVVVVVVR